MTTSGQFHREYLVRLPLPLAQLYSRAFNAKEARARHDNAFYLFESLIKLAAAPAIAAYLAEVERGGTRVPALDRLLAPLALPSLGQWVAMLRELSRHFGARPDAASHPLGHLWNQLEPKHRDLPAILALYRRIKNGPDGEAAGDQSCSLLDLLDALVQYRNGVFGHGASRFDAFYEQEMGPLLLPAASELLAEGVWDFLGPRGSRLVYLTELRTVAEGQVQISLMELVGRESERMEPQELSSGEAASLVPNCVAVLWPGRRVPLRLDPLLVFRGNELAEEVLFLNRDRNGRQAEYLSYTTGRTERDRSMGPALAKLLSQITGREVSEDELEKISQQSLAETPSVEALFGPGPPPVNQVGDYELLAEIGRGGMGVVYLARQLSLGRLVALKMLPADLAADEVALARFRREMRALGRCEHPNIVKVLSNGTLPDGRLYYTMEYVPGADLEMTWRELAGPNRQGAASTLGGTTWSKAVLTASRKQRAAAAKHATEGSAAGSAAAPLSPDSAQAVLPTPAPAAIPELPLPPLPELPSVENDPGGYSRRVAQLIRDAALALQAVHEQGIVHRDVKPANLMLTPDGARVVLMDFGLAKGQSVSLSASKAGGLLGTLRYAAPEQLAAASLRVGATADIRGLGVTLWELLTRERLFGEAEDERQLAAMVHDQDVPRLRSIDPTLDADLEAIVARATERRVADRIQTAAQLAEYLQLYLDGKPLPIRPPSAAELLRRWVREHKGLVGSMAAAIAAIVLTVAIAFISITAAKNEAVEARNDAVESKNRAVKLADEKTQLADEKAKLAETEQQSRRRADEQSQLALATLKSVVFDIQTKLAGVAGAQDVRKSLLNTAIAGLEKVAHTLDSVAQANHAMVWSHLELGDTFLLVGGDKGSGGTELARQQYESARQIAQRLNDNEPQNSEAQRDLSASLEKLGNVDLRLGNLPAAREAYQKSSDLFLKLAQVDPTDARVQRELSVSYAKLGDVNLHLDNVPAARETYQKGLDIFFKLAQADPTNAEGQCDLAISYASLGDVNLRLGDVRAARDAYQKGLDILLKLVQADPANAQAQRDLSVSYNHLGDMNLQLRNAPSAREAYQKGMEISLKLSQADPDNALARRQLSVSYSHLGDVNLQLGNVLAAREAYQQNLDITLKLAQADPTNAQLQRELSVSYERLGDANLRLDNVSAAREAYQKDSDIAVKLAQADPTNVQVQRDLSLSYGRLGNVFMQLRNIPAAREAYQKALDIDLKLAQPDPANAQAQRDLSVSYEKLGNAEQQLGNLSAARDAYQNSSAIDVKLAQVNPTDAQTQHDLSISYNDLGDMNLQLGNVPAAREAYQSELNIRLKLAQVDPTNAQAQRELGVSYSRLGDANQRLDNLPSAREEYQKSVDISRKLTRDDPTNIQAQLDLAYGLMTLAFAESSVNEFQAAEKQLQQGVEILTKLRQEGKLVNQSFYEGALKNGQRLLQVCRAAPRAIDDLEFALKQPKAIAPELLAIRGRALARRGRHTDAAATAEKLVTLDPNDGDATYRAAGVYSLCGAGDDKQLRERYASRAIELLDRAKTINFFKDAENRVELQYDHSLDPLRSRDDFKKLLAEVLALPPSPTPANH